MKEMIRQRMKKLHRGNSSSSDKSGERIDFKFSSFQALQVPKGWDKLSVSLVSVETGKTISKTGRASVWNGNCRWTETLSECVWVQDDSKELEQCLYKLLVSMGSARSGILGEVTVNLAGHMSSTTSAPIALPLKNCDHGTILQVQIQCLTPRTTLRWKDSDSLTDDANADYNDIDNKSDASDGRFTKSEGSSSSTFFSTSHTGEPGSRGTSLSGVGSHRSFDSVEDSLGRESFSPQSNVSGVMNNVVGRQDSTGSQNSASHVYDSPKSSHSSYNSGTSGSGKYLHNQREDSGQLSHAIAASPLRNGGLSEFVPEAEGVAMEELRAEARMWERNARKAMLDLEFSRKESSNQAKDMANLEMELSALQTECDGLKQEIKHLKILLDESTLKQEDAENLKLQVQDKRDIQREMEEETRFLKESNGDLALQLNKTQESNLELVSVLQELEETIEKQKMEIESLSQQSETDLLAPIEENDKLNLEIQLKQFQETQKNLEHTILNLEETLENKNVEIENERDLSTRTLMDCESEWRSRLTLKEKEIFNLEAKLSEALTTHDSMAIDSEASGNLDLIKEIQDLKEKVLELERDCNELTDENLELLFKLKESSKDLSTSGASFSSSSHDRATDDSPSTSGSEVSKLESQLWQLKEEMKKRELDGLATGYIQARCNDLENKCTDLELELQTFKDRASYLDGELKKCHARAEEQENEIAALYQQLKRLPEGKTENSITQKGQSELVQENSVHPNRSLEASTSLHEEEIDPVIAGARKVGNRMVDNNLEEDISCLSNQELVGSNQKLKSRVDDLAKELLLRSSEIEELKTECFLKEQEIEARRCNQRDLETEISDLQKIRIQMKEILETMEREGKITSECLDNLRSDMVVLSSKKDTHISANKILERKSEELESCKQELELNLLELEQENVHLSERISGLEAQLRYLTDAKESSRLDVQHSESQVMNLQDEIRKLENEMETQKVDMREKLQEMQQRWLEAQEECEYLKKANPKLQATTESLIEECSSLQQSNRELRQQRLELHNKCTVLEAKLRESKSNFSDCSKKMEDLEERFSSMLDDISSKEKVLDAELEALHMQNKEHQEKLVLGESLLSQMYAEKVAEVQNLQQEVSHLSDQISATHDERDRMASEAVLEMHLLRADKEKLEAALEEVQGKFESSAKKLGSIKMEYETNVAELTHELAASKQNHEFLVANHVKVMELLENTRCNEEKLKATIDELDSKLKSSEYERLQLAEEITSLKAQLQKIPLLQDEVLALKSTLYETKFENQRLESSLELVSGDYEELKNEKILLVEKTSSMQKAVSELEDFKRSKVALEEKLLRLEGDLTAREALSAQDFELKNDLGRIKRTNSQLQWKIKCLQVEKEECLKKVEVLNEELEQKKQDQNETSADTLALSEDEQTGTSTQLSTDQQKPSRTDQLKQISRSQDTEGIVEDSTQINRLDNQNGSNQEMIADTLSRIRLLENELAEALEANDMYKSQLKSLLSEKELCGKSREENSAIDKEDNNKHKASSLEAELTELRERYLEMSLKYAEVEAQREQLVLQFKSQSKGKSWFS